MSDDIPFAQLFAILRRRRGIVIVFALSGAVAAGLLGAWIPPQYTAKALLVVQFPSAVSSPALSSPASSDNDDAVVQTHVAALESPSRLHDVLAGFAEDPEVKAALNDDLQTSPAGSTRQRTVADRDSNFTASSTGDLWDDLSVRISSLADEVWRVLLGDQPKRNLTRLARFAPEDLKRRLTVQQERGSHVIAVSMTWTDPEVAAALANRSVRLYLESEKERTDKDLASELSWIDTRIQEESAKYERAYAALQTYRNAHVHADQKELLDRQIAYLEGQLTSASQSAQLLAPRISELQQRIATLQRNRDQASKDSYALADLDRTAALHRKAHEDLQHRRRQLAERQEVIAPQLRLLSFAKPPAKPTSPAPILFMLPAIVAFVILGSLVAVLRDRLDRSIRAESDIAEALGLPCLAFVPRLVSHRHTTPHQHLIDNPLAPYAEAIRSLSATTTFSLEDAHGEVLLVSSSLPGEGKTTLAASIAVHAATLGRRVLLLDVDSRRSSSMQEADTHLEGTSPFSLSPCPESKAAELPTKGAIRHISGLGIDHLSMRSDGSEPLLLYARAGLAQLIGSVRSGYDLIVLDGPPLLLVAEARILAKLADKILFVVKWGSTTREVAQAGHALLAAAAADKVLGVVVTQVNLKRHARGRYGGPPEYQHRYSAHLSILKAPFSLLKAPQAPPVVPIKTGRASRYLAIRLVGLCLIAGAAAGVFLYGSDAADRVTTVAGIGDRRDQPTQQREVGIQAAAAPGAASEEARNKEVAEQTAATAQQALRKEEARTAGLVHDLDAARREIETQAAAARTASSEAARVKEAAERSASELRRALKEEHDKSESLAGDLATARRQLQTRTEALGKVAGEQTARSKELEQLLATRQDDQKALDQERARSKQLEQQLAARQDDQTALAQERVRSKQLEQQLAARQDDQAALAQERARSKELEQQLAAANQSAQQAPAQERARGQILEQQPRDASLLPPALDLNRSSQVPPAGAGGRSAKATPEPGAKPDTAKPVAPAVQQPVNPPADLLMARAKLLLSQGDVGAARAVLERAEDSGSALATFELAETYDPAVLSAWGTVGTQGDPAKARELYAKAAAAGVEEAKIRLAKLQ